MKINIKSVKIKNFSMKIKIFHMKISSFRENQIFSRKCELKGFLVISSVGVNIMAVIASLPLKMVKKQLRILE